MHAKPDIEHCPQRNVVFSTDGDVDMARLSNITDLSDATRQNGEIRLEGIGDAFVSHVIRAIAEQNIHVLNFRTELPSLEDVFLKLTGHGIRD